MPSTGKAKWDKQKTELHLLPLLLLHLLLPEPGWYQDNHDFKGDNLATWSALPIVRVVSRNSIPSFFSPSSSRKICRDSHRNLPKAGVEITWAASRALLLPLKSSGWRVRPRRTAANTWHVNCKLHIAYCLLHIEYCIVGSAMTTAGTPRVLSEIF